MTRIFCILLLIASPSLYAENLIQNAKSCFRGAFESHEKWANFLAEKKPKFNKEKFSTFTREKYNKFKQKQECIDFTYQVDGLTISGYYIKPKQTADEKLPIVIYNRGGNPKHPMIFGSKMLKLSPVASNKYIVLASQYRGASRWLKNNGKDEFGGADINDVVKLVELAKEIPNADTSRIALFGWSRGVMQSYLAAKQLPEVKAIIAGAGNSDTSKALKWRPEMEKIYSWLVPNFKENREEELRKRSVIRWLDDLPKAPILLLHGDNDKRVNVEQSKQLAKKLEEAKRPNKLVIYKGGTHSLRKFQNEYLTEVHQWLEKYL